MTNLYIITVAYCRSAQLANCLMNFKTVQAKKHIIVQGHYPIDKERNNKEIELITKSYAANALIEVELWDPGDNLGSAQSQNWVLKKLNLQDDDCWVNLDPDSICHPHWMIAAQDVLNSEPECAFVSCMSPMVKSFLREPFGEKQIESEHGFVSIGIPTRPTPFNLTMFRGKFMREIVEFSQMGLFWGELEAVMYSHCQRLGYYHAYLLDYMEDESGKFFHPKENAHWKDLHCRTWGPDQFAGNFEEYLRYYRPDLIDLRL